MLKTSAFKLSYPFESIVWIFNICLVVIVLFFRRAFLSTLWMGLMIWAVFSVFGVCYIIFDKLTVFENAKKGTRFKYCAFVFNFLHAQLCLALTLYEAIGLNWLVWMWLVLSLAFSIEIIRRKVLQQQRI